MRALVTRPEPGASATAHALRERGIEPVVAPLLAPRWLTPGLPDPADVDGVVLTSANGLRGVMALAGAADFLGKPVYAVGDATAEAARAAGFTEVHSADGAFADLVELVSARVVHGTLLYPRARDVSGDLGAAFAGDGIGLSEAVVYAMEPVKRLPVEAETGLAGNAIAAVLLYSRRTAEAFVGLTAELPGPARETIVPLCLAQKVAEPLAGAGFAAAQIAGAPNEAAMLLLASSFAGRQKSA